MMHKKISYGICPHCKLPDTPIKKDGQPYSKHICNKIGFIEKHQVPITLILTFGLVIFGGLGWMAADKQANILGDEFVSNNRPWTRIDARAEIQSQNGSIIFVNLNSDEINTENNNIVKSTPSEIQQIVVNIFATNIGKIPAKSEDGVVQTIINGRNFETVTYKGKNLLPGQITGFRSIHLDTQEWKTILEKYGCNIGCKIEFNVSMNYTQIPEDLIFEKNEYSTNAIILLDIQGTTFSTGIDYNILK